MVYRFTLYIFYYEISFLNTGLFFTPLNNSATKVLIIKWSEATAKSKPGSSVDPNGCQCDREGATMGSINVFKSAQHLLLNSCDKSAFFFI